MFIRDLTLKNKKSVFTRQVLTLMSGTGIAQIIPVVIAPLLARLYTPEDFGVLALFSALTAILSISATGKYELAIVLPEDEKDSLTLAILAFFITLILSFIVLILVLLFKDEIAGLLNNLSIAGWLYFVPLVTFFMGLFNVLNYLNLNYEKYGVIAKANIYRSLTSAAGQAGIGLLKNGPAGLIIGKLLSYMAANVPLSGVFINRRELWNDLKRVDYIRLAKRYIRFPKYSLPGLFTNSVTQNINNFFISILYASQILGFYAMVYRVLGLPLGLVSSAFAQVFLKKASENRKEEGSARRLFKRIFIRLLLLGLALFVPLYFVIEDLFVLVFGQNWLAAGSYAQILLPLFFARFVVTPLSTVVIAFEKQMENMIWQFAMLLITIAVFWIAWQFHLSIEQFLWTVSLTLSLHYAVLLGMVYHFSAGTMKTTG